MKNNINTPVIKGQKYNVHITGMGHSGEGVGRIDNFTVFVPQALINEEVEVLIIEVKKTYSRGKLLKVIKPSTYRVQPKCDIYHNCGGCQLQHLDYNKQLEFKRQQVVDNIERIGKLTNVEILPTIGAENPWYYRNKMQFPVGQVKGELAIGCYAQGTHSIIDTKDCFIQHQTNNIIVNTVKEIIKELNIQPYNEQDGSGVIRHILGRVGVMTGDVMVVLITVTNKIPQETKLINKLKDKIPGLKSIIQNINYKKTNIILGHTTKTLWGQDHIVDALGDLKFNISAKSFFQINNAQTVKLYNKAVEFANLTGKETVIDAYCGTGTISLFMAQKAKQVYGIEIVEPAIKDAIKNAENNNIHNTEFIVGDALEVMPKLYKEGIKPEVVVVDPPRAGCHEGVLETFVNMKPDRIVYISCNPSSLARDLAILADKGYKTKVIQPVDMFPMTYHVECVVLIERE